MDVLSLRITFLHSVYGNSSGGSISSHFVESSEHEPCHRQVDHRLTALWQELVVFGQPPILAYPGKGAFYYPTPRQHLYAATSGQD